MLARRPPAYVEITLLESSRVCQSASLRWCFLLAAQLPTRKGSERDQIVANQMREERIQVLRILRGGSGLEVPLGVFASELVAMHVAAVPGKRTEVMPILAKGWHPLDSKCFRAAQIRHEARRFRRGRAEDALVECHATETPGEKSLCFLQLPDASRPSPLCSTQVFWMLQKSDHPEACETCAGDCSHGRYRMRGRFPH